MKTTLHFKILMYAMLLFISERTFSQLTLIKDIYLGTLGSEPREMTPMGNNVLEVFRNFPEWHKLSITEYNAMCNHMNIVQSYKETWQTIDDKIKTFFGDTHGIISKT